MIKAIIADDEKLDRLGLNLQIDWSLFDIEITGLAEDGFEALELLESTGAEVLITDVKMPGMSGHELIEKAKKYNPDIQVVFISGYDDFNYVKRAIQLEAAEYILKPVNTDELIEAVERVVNKIKSRRQNQVVIEKLDESSVAVRTKFIKDLAYGTVNSINIEESIDRWDIELFHYAFKVAIIEVESINTREISESQIDRLVLETVQEVNRKRSDIAMVYFIDDTGRIIVIISSAKKVERSIGKEMTFYLKKLNEKLHVQLDLVVTMAIGDMVKDYMDISKSYNNASEKLLLKMIYGKGHVFEELLTVSHRIDNEIVSRTITEISESIYNYDEMKMNHLVNYLFEQLKENKVYQKTFIQDVCLNLISRVQIAINDRNISFEEIFGSNTIVWEKLLKFDTIVDIRQWIKNILKSIIGYMSDYEQSNEHIIVTGVVEEVRKHYMNPLTLKLIAEKLGYSPNHLGYIFKQEMGRGFNDFLIEYRMKKSIDYLKDSRMKLYEVALEVSYKNVNAFTGQFKKYYGITPKEYRKKYLMR